MRENHGLETEPLRHRQQEKHSELLLIKFNQNMIKIALRYQYIFLNGQMGRLVRGGGRPLENLIF